MRSALVFLALAASTASAAEPVQRDDCPTPEDYFSGNGWYGLALVFQQNQSDTRWTTLDYVSQNMMTTQLYPADFASYWFTIAPGDAYMYYQTLYAGFSATVQPAQAGEPLQLYYGDNQPLDSKPYATFEVVAQDCQLWVVVNGSSPGIPNPYQKRDDSATNIWQFGAGSAINSSIVYEGPGNPNANAALQLQPLVVTNPMPSAPPKNDTNCYTVDDYWNGNRSNWQFGFTRKDEFYWEWLGFDPDTQYPVYYAYTGDAAQPRPENWLGLEINPATKRFTAIGFGPATDRGRSYTVPLGSQPGQIWTFDKRRRNQTSNTALANLVAVNCNLYVVALGTESESIWQWGLPAGLYPYVGSWGPGHPRANAAMWTIPVEDPPASWE